MTAFVKHNSFDIRFLPSKWLLSYTLFVQDYLWVFSIMVYVNINVYKLLMWQYVHVFAKFLQRP